MLYSCIHMATVGVKWLTWTSNACAVLKVDATEFVVVCLLFVGVVAAGLSSLYPFLVVVVV